MKLIVLTYSAEWLRALAIKQNQFGNFALVNKEWIPFISYRWE